MVAIIAAILVSLPVSWVYMAVRGGDEYDQSLVNTIIVLPMVVTGIVIIVQNWLALAFSLAGIAGAVRFRNSLKSSGDALFILLAVGVGLAAGIGAIELAAVISDRLQLLLRAAVDHRIWRARGDEALPRRLSAERANNRRRGRGEVLATQLFSASAAVEVVEEPVR